MARVFVISAPEDIPSFEAVVLPVLRKLRLDVQLFGQRHGDRPDRILILLSPNAVRSPSVRQNIDACFDSYIDDPDQLAALMLQRCSPGAAHPALDWLTDFDYFDFTGDSKHGQEALFNSWHLVPTARPKPSKPILLMLNLKGGVAKTTTAVAVAEGLATLGRHVLVIDADHQCAAGELLIGGKRLLLCDKQRRTLHHLLIKMTDNDFDIDNVSKYILSNVSNIGSGLPNLSVLPCSLKIEDFARNRAKGGRPYAASEELLQFLVRKRAQRFRRWLVDNYDFVFIDCPPSIPMQVEFLLHVSDGFIVPAQPDRLSCRGSRYLMDRIWNMGFRSKQGIGTIWSLYRKENSIHNQIIDAAFARKTPLDVLPPPFSTKIPNATAIARSAEEHQHPATFNHKYEKRFADLYMQVCRDIIERTSHTRLAQQR